MKYYIYKIVVGDKIYIGSTKQPDDRWRRHKACATKPISHTHYTVYTEMREYGIEKCIFEIIHEIECDTKKESYISEQNEINLIPDHLSLNDKNAYTSYEERKLYQQEFAKIRWTNIKYDPDHILKRQNWNRERYNRLKQDPEWVIKENERQRLYREDQRLNNAEEFSNKSSFATRKWMEENQDKVKAAQARRQEKRKNDPAYQERERLYRIEYNKRKLK